MGVLAGAPASLLPGLRKSSRAGMPEHHPGQY